MSDSLTIDALLGLGIVAAWLGCLGFFKSGHALDQINRPIFLASTTGTALVLAGLLYEGLTVRVGKLVLLEAVLLVSAIVMSKGLRNAGRRMPRPLAVPIRRRD